MFFKVVNNLIGPNKLVLILLILAAYPKITDLNVSSLLITQRTMAIKKLLVEFENLLYCN